MRSPPPHIKTNLTEEDMNTLEVGADDEDDLKDIRLPMPNGS